MKKTFLAIILCAAPLCPFTLWADNSLKDAYKSVLKLTTYDARGKELATSTAFLCNKPGQVVAAYSALKDATKVELTDFKGNKYALSRILGANATTDIVTFSLTEVPKKLPFFALSATTSHQGATLQMLQYAQDKKTLTQQVNIEKAEPFNSYTYYYTNATNVEANFACPLIDETGCVVAIVQKNVAKDANGACAIDARFVNDLSITATSSINADLLALHFPKALPSNKRDALTYLYMLPQADSTIYATACQDFITAYPTLPDGYVTRANFLITKKQYAAAQTDYSTALQYAATPTDSTAMTAADIHYALSNQIYRNIMAQGKDTLAQYPQWTLALAESEADKAYQDKANALYLVQKGNCLYARRQYKEAYNNFVKACDDKTFASSETYFSAARSLELSGGNKQQVLALLDSCIALIPSQAGSQYAQFYLERSQRLIQSGKYREAVKDYNAYEQIIGPRNLTDIFYDLRAQAEEKARMYQQALDDYNTAISISKQPIPYQIDRAALLLNVGEFASAIEAAEIVLKALPENPDCYKILGVAHGELKHKAQAIKYLQKAKQLGDDSVDHFIEKYSK